MSYNVIDPNTGQNISYFSNPSQNVRENLCSIRLPKFTEFYEESMWHIYKSLALFVFLHSLNFSTMFSISATIPIQDKQMLIQTSTD